jgi:hypothetical protein
LIFTLQTFVAHIILVIPMNFIAWLRGIVDTSTYVPLSPGEGTASVMDSVAPNPGPLSTSTIKAIRDNTTLTTGIVLGFIIIIAINYARSPWRKLPPGPRRLPVLGNALQLWDRSWLLSRDCKERFGEFSDYIRRGMLRGVYGHCRRGYIS